MAENIKIYATDLCWQHILADLGAVLVESPNVADVVFDDLNIQEPVSLSHLKSIIFDSLDNRDIIKSIFGQFVMLPALQRKIVVLLYKNPDISINELKELLGVLPNVTTHTVENAIYQLRKNYGHEFIINAKGKYKIGHI